MADVGNYDISTSDDDYEFDLPPPTLDLDIDEDDIDTVDERLVNRTQIGLVEMSDTSIVEGEDLPQVEYFEDMGIRDNILSGIYEAKFEEPSLIQRVAIPAILGNRDNHFIGQAPSGQGKTGAFVISCLQTVEEENKNLQVLLVCPTRELANQIYSVIDTLGKDTNVSRKALLGGQAIRPGRIIDGQVLISTPGKLKDAMDKRALNLRDLKMIIIDEADAIFDQHLDEITAILNKLDDPKMGAPHTQKVLFSATFPEDMSNIERFVPEPRIKFLLQKESLVHGSNVLPQFWISAVGDFYTAKTLEESIVQKLLTTKTIIDTFSANKIIIFCRTRDTADYVANQLKKSEVEIKTGVLHGRLEREERDLVMSDFRSGVLNTLVSTNVLARGIDILNVSLVINFDIPIVFNTDRNAIQEPDYEAYYHRIGRTGRFGAKGAAISLVHNQGSKEILDEIRKYYGSKFEIKEIKRDWVIHFNDTATGDFDDMLQKCRSSHGVIILFSLSDPESFNEAKEIYYNQLSGLEDKPPVMLIGNKSDEERKVTSEEAESFSREKGIPYDEISVKEKTNVKDAVEQLLGLSPLREEYTVTVVGAKGVGKTSLILSLSEKKFETALPAVIEEPKTAFIPFGALKFWCENFSADAHEI